MGNSTACKYKTAKDIQKPLGIYHYVGESSCCAKFTEIGSPILGGQIGEVLVFLLTKHTHTHTHTHTQTNNFFHLAYRSQIWTELNALKLIIRGFRCRCAFWWSRRWSITFMGPKPQKSKFWGVHRHFKTILQKIQIPISSKLCIGLAKKLTGWCSTTKRLH